VYDQRVLELEKGCPFRMRWFLVWKHSVSVFDRYQGFLQPSLWQVDDWQE